MRLTKKVLNGTLFFSAGWLRFASFGGLQAKNQCNLYTWHPRVYKA